MSGWVLGVIGGSGLYEIDGLTEQHWKRIASPSGEASEILYGVLNVVEVPFPPATAAAVA